jgi:putative ABC transport system ATP-binding protein
LTALENVALPLDVRGERGPDARDRARVALERVGLGDKIDAHPADLSGGQKQRVAIARALVGDPSIVLADEPTAALDSVSGRTVLELLRDLARGAGRAIVLVTHDARAVAYADRVVSIEDGRLREGAHDPAPPAPVPLAGADPCRPRADAAARPAPRVAGRTLEGRPAAARESAAAR